MVLYYDNKDSSRSANSRSFTISSYFNIFSVFFSASNFTFSFILLDLFILFVNAFAENISQSYFVLRTQYFAAQSIRDGNTTHEESFSS